jgi:putative addiction module killer protein
MEARIHQGAGYRVYFIQHGATVIIILCGGDKSSQDKDIAKAKAMAREWRQ